MIFRALFDFTFKQRAGAAIIRMIYTASFVVLTIGLCGAVVHACVELDHALALHIRGDRTINYSMLARGDYLLRFWGGFLAALVPTYIGALVVNRLLAELCLALLRISDATEARSSVPATANAEQPRPYEFTDAHAKAAND